MIRPGDAAGTIRAFFEAYLVRRDLNRTLSFLSENVHWVGTGKSELIRGRAQAGQALSAKFTREPNPYGIVYESVEEVPAADNCAVVLITAAVSPPDANESIRIHVTATCAVEEDAVCRIAAIHTSTSGERREEGRFSSPHALGRSEPERRLSAGALDLLGGSIPGGMMGGYLEPDFPLYYVNDALLSYLGYGREEFIAAIDGRVVNCIHPDDRDRVDAVVARALQNGAGYEAQYRMRKKGGGYIWVNAIGKKGRSEDGREICISVIRDISSEVEAREGLRIQAEEQKLLALQYDHLFQSVLCGIVQYRLLNGGVTFLKANREAIRIFGYEPEEIWAKRVWELSSMIAEEDRDYIMKALTKLRRPGDKEDFEFRLLRKDGASCWIIGSAEVVADSDGATYIQSVFLDINDRKKIEQRNQRLIERAEASDELLHLALEHTITSEFYYYPQTGICTVPARTCGIYHCRERYEGMPYSYAVEQVDEAFRPAFYEMFEKIRRGERTASCDFRGIDGHFWCHETLTVILSGENGAPQFVIGIVENITRQKEMEAALEETRSRDGLTGLYNKETGVQLVQRYMKQERRPEDHCVMMLLDMDDFKAVNQKEGRVFADAILQETADILRAQTGPDDIQIRLGGDEFMLLVKHCDKKRAVEVGPRIAACVQNILVDVKKDIQASVSIGMCSTEIVEDYHALYRCAESTLHYVKEHGKGRAACYLDTSNEVGVYLTQLYTEERAVNAIERDTSRGTDLISFALDLLGKSKNLEDAVSLLLARIGKLYQFDRVSIIDASREYLTYRFSYQWARERSDYQLGQDFYVTDEDFEICIHMYDGEGLAEENVREGISRFPSCLHSAIWNYGEYVGSMSFEVDRPGYRWTPEQRKLLKELVKIVPSFIMKAKADAVSRAKTDFLSHMSHEIRTPMNAISGMTVIAKSVLGNPEKTRECLEKIESANAYLLDLVNDVLEMSRIESGKLELNYAPENIAQMFSGLETLFRSQASGKHLELFFINGYQEDRPLRADGLRLNQVMVNIIGNAIKFTDEGSVTVRADRLPAKSGAVLRFSVTDTGIGIEPASVARIFRPFEQAEANTVSQHGGTGLGLSISSRLVQMMGGALEVRSEVGRGSEFFFTLTLEYASGEAVGDTGQNPPDCTRDFHGKRILLAEDNELNREIAQTILEMNGFAVVCTSNGQEVLERFRADGPGRYDAILMDIRMPVMDGLEATRRIRTSDHPDARKIPIIALTANAFGEDTKKSMTSGMNGHLSKPIQVEQLLALLDKHIA